MNVYLKPVIQALGLVALAFSTVASAATADSARVSTALGADGAGRIVVEATGVRAEAPLFFTARAEQVVRVGADAVTGEARRSCRCVSCRDGRRFSRLG